MARVRVRSFSEGGAVVRLCFRVFFSSSSSSSARAARACTKLWFADLDSSSSSPAAFFFSRFEERHDELLFLVQGSVELTTTFRFFGFVLVFLPVQLIGDGSSSHGSVFVKDIFVRKRKEEEDCSCKTQEEESQTYTQTHTHTHR